MKSIFTSIIALGTLHAYSQNVGIGTATPQAKLEVRNPVMSSILIKSEAYFDTSRIVFSNRLGTAGTDIILSSNRETGLNISSASDLPANNQATILKISPAGNVGVGVLSPAEKLDVAGNIQASGIIEGTGHTFATPKTYYYSLSGSDMVTKSSGDAVERETLAGGGAFIIGGGGGLTAGVHLPHGATVTRMTVYFYDVSSINLQVTLRRNSLIAAMAQITSSGAPGESSLFDNSISNAAIDNSINAYTIDIMAVGGPWPDVSLIIRKIIFEYTVAAL